MLQSKGGGSVKCHGVGRVGTVGPDRFGKCSGKLAEWAFSGGRRFSPIEPSGKHKGVNDFDFALPRPWSVAKRVAELGGLGQALVDSRTTQAGSKTKMPSEVPHGHQDLHSGPNVNPVLVAQDSSRRGAGAEEVALAGRYLGAECVEVAEGGSISCLNAVAMIRPNAINEEVVGQ